MPYGQKSTQEQSSKRMFCPSYLVIPVKLIWHVYRRRQIFNSICNDATPFFISNELKMHFYRLHGDYSTAINRPGNPSLVNPKKKISHGPLDLRKGAHEIFYPANFAACFCGDLSRDPTAHSAEIDAYNKKGKDFPTRTK